VPNCLLIVFDDARLHDESMRYAIELAKRLDCGLSALVLPGESADRSVGTASGFDAVRQVARAEGVDLELDLCEGDPPSLLLKYLATHPPLRALVWGGDAAVVSAHPQGGGRHWFGRVRRQIRCPVVTAEASTRQRGKRLA
jgi:hypothetical protein